jgi:hypothetical protein
VDAGPYQSVQKSTSGKYNTVGESTTLL